MIRIGFGFDSHRFEAGTNKPLVLCGVKVPHDRHLVAHSDGDAPIHALIDAMFGAAGVGDIGEHFPDTNPKFANAESTRLLTDAMTMLAEMGWIVVNADVTIVAEAPRLETHKFPMRLRLADLLGLDTSMVSVKAKTAEGLGPLGAGDGLAAYAVVLLEEMK